VSLPRKNIALFDMDLQIEVAIKVALMVEFDSHTICDTFGNVDLLSHFLALDS